MLRHLLFFSLALTVFSAKSQQVFEGYILADSISTTQVNIVNLNKKNGVVNNKKGKFSIAAKVGDSLVFSSVQYEPHAIKVLAEHLKKVNYIYLYRLVNKLETVKLSNIKLSGNLNKDVTTIDTYVFDPAEFGLPLNTGKVRTMEEKRLYTAQTGGPVGVLVDVLSGRMAMLERQIEYAKLEQLVEKVRNKLSEKYFIDNLKLKPEKIDDFLYFIEKTDASLKQKLTQLNVLEFMDYLKTKLPAYWEYKN